MRRSPCHCRCTHRRPASTSATHVKIPSGPWELSRSLRHVLAVVHRSVSHSCASETRGKRVSSFPSGRWELLKVSAARTACSLPKSSQLCKRESRQARQQFSHRGDGKFAGVAGTYRSLIDESRFGHVSHLPIGAMGSLQAWLARTYP